MASRRLRRRARMLANAANAPARHALHSQIKGTKHDAAQQAASIASMGAALQQAIGGARHDFKHTPGLTGRDLRIGLETLGRDRVYAAEGAAAQTSALHQDTQSALADLRGQLVAQGVQQGADVQAELEKLIENRQANRQATKAAHYTQAQENLRALITHPPTAGKAGAAGALTPYEQRGIKRKRADALALVRNALAASHAGAEGAPPVPKGPKEWQSWADQLAVKSTGIARNDIGWAISQIHQPQSSVWENLIPQAIHALQHAGTPAKKKAHGGLPSYLHGLTLPGG